jgi:ABC-type multidrug transport system fused ATPase/permease subunit|mmetsp:Transcript_8753/g.28153  ORF Transcript_8753/g.28153 Transcript_8753/m.28153 type:complete len:226 (+) Transcript_8753:1018-1695(+)
MGVYETVRRRTTTTTTCFETLVYAYTSFICILPQLLLVIIISITTKHILAKFFSKFLKREFLTSSTPQPTHISTTICSSISQCPSQLFARVREQTRRTKSTRAFLAKRVTQTRLVSRSVARVYRLRVHASLFERRHVHLLLFSIFSLLLLLLKLLLLGRRIIIITIVLIIISSAAMTTVYGRRRRAVVHRRRHPDMFVLLLLLQKLLLSVIIVITCSSSSSSITR